MTERLKDSKCSKWWAAALKSPFGWFFSLAMTIYFVAKLPPEQFEQVEKILYKFDNPIGIIILVGLGFTASYQLIARPIGLYLKGFLDDYLDKEKEHIKATAKIATLLNNLETTLREEVIPIIKKVSAQLQDNTKQIQKNRVYILKVLKEERKRCGLDASNDGNSS